MTTETALKIIADKSNRQRDIAILYAELIASGFGEWATINQAIVTRWSEAGLRRVKTMAWKIF